MEHEGLPTSILQAQEDRPDHRIYKITSTRRGNLYMRRAVYVFASIMPVGRMGLEMVGQPAPQYYLHRPLGLLLHRFYGARFVLDRQVFEMMVNCL